MQEKNIGLLEYDHRFKIILKGNENAGKSCIIKSFIEDIFLEKHDRTIGVDFNATNLIVNNEKVKLQIWDSSGDKQYKEISSEFNRGAHIGLFVYDVTDRASFDDIESFIKEFADNDHVIKVVVGNKIDDVENRSVSYAEAKELAEKLGCSFIEVSAKTGQNINELFQKATSEKLTYLTSISREKKEENTNLPRDAERIPRKVISNYPSSFLNFSSMQQTDTNQVQGCTIF
ncbi:MAG: GTP-binding protein [Legionella longbeachae]|nr:GTP-binding protein [Legionella longbeachae]